MATPANIYNGAIVEQHEVFLVSADSIMAATTFLAYSHFVVLDQEVSFIWSNPRRPASWLYLLIRYPGLLSQLIGVGLNSYTPGCTGVYKLSFWANTIAIATTYAFQILRTYAVCGRNVKLAAFLTLMAIPTIAVCILQSVEISCSNSVELTTLQSDIELGFDLLFESLILVATLWGTRAQFMGMRALGLSRLGKNLAVSILRNGLAYYGLFVVVRGCTLVTKNLTRTPIVSKIDIAANSLVYPLRWTLSCQFILELRARVEKGTYTSFSVPSASGPRGALGSDSIAGTAVRARLALMRAKMDADFADPETPDHLGEDEDGDRKRLADSEDGRTAGTATFLSHGSDQDDVLELSELSGVASLGSVKAEPEGGLVV